MKQIPKYKEVAKKYSNMNVEVGEKTLLPTGLLVDHGGDKHSEGGTDVNLPEGAMIFSNAMKLDKNVVALLLNKDKSKVKRMTPAELAKKYATNQLLENIESPDKYKANSAKLMLEKNIAQLNSIFQAQEEHKKVNGIESGKTLAEQGMKAEYGTAKYGGVAQVGVPYSLPTTNPQMQGLAQYNQPQFEDRSFYNIKPISSGLAPKWIFDNASGQYIQMTPGYTYDQQSRTIGGATTEKDLFTANQDYITDGVIKNENLRNEFAKQTAYNPTTGQYEFDTPEKKAVNQQTLQHLLSDESQHIPGRNAYGKHYSIVVTDETGNKYVVEGSNQPSATVAGYTGLPSISKEEVLNNLSNYTAEFPATDQGVTQGVPFQNNAFAHDYNYNDLVTIKEKQQSIYSPFDDTKRLQNPFGSNLPVTNPYGVPKPINSTTPNVVQKPMTDYAIKSHNQIAADLYRKLFSAEMQAPYEIFNPGIAPVVRPAYQSTAPVQQALNNLSYTLDNSNASTQYGNALYAEGLAKSLDSVNQISRYNQQAAMEAEQKNTGNLVNTFNQNQQGFAANANQNNLNFLRAKDRYELYKDDLFSRVLENQVDRNTYEGMLQDRRLTERYSPSELLDRGFWKNFTDPQRYMQFDNKDTLNPDNGQKLSGLGDDMMAKLKNDLLASTDTTEKAKLWELYLKYVTGNKSQSDGYLKKKDSYQTGTIRTDSPYKYNWGSSTPTPRPLTDYGTTVSKSDLIARQRKADNIGSQADKILQMKPIGTSNSQISWYQSLTPEELSILKQSKYASKLAPIEAQIRIAEADEANKKGFIAGLKDPELMRIQTQAIGDKLGIPGIPDVVDPLTYVGQIASNLGSVPSDIQRGNYGSAALSVIEPLAVGALGTVGAKNTGQWVNNIVNPLAGVESQSSKINNIEKNLKDLEYAKTFAKKYGYELPKNINRIAESDILTDKTVRGLMNRHNTFTRGVSTNWEEINKKNPELVKYFESKGIDWKNNPEEAARVMLAEVPPETGYGRFMMNKGENAIYTSNSIPTAEGYTYGDGYYAKIRRKDIDFSSNNRIDWINNNNPSYQKGVNDPNGANIIKTDWVKRFPTKLEDFVKSSGNPNIIDELTNNIKLKVSNKKDIHNKKWDDLVNTRVKIYDSLDEKIKKLYPNVQSRFEIADDVLEKLLTSSEKKDLSYTEKEIDKLRNYDYTKYENLVGLKEIFTTPQLYKSTLKNLFSPDKFAHYAFKGNPGEELFDIIDLKRMSPDMWVNKSRAHIGTYSKKLSALQVGGTSINNQQNQTGVKTTNYVKPVVPLQKYLTVDTIVPQQVKPISTPLVQKVKQVLLSSNTIVPTESGYSPHSKASDKVYEQQTGGFNLNTFNSILYGDMQSGGNVEEYCSECEKERMQNGGKQDSTFYAPGRKESITQDPAYIQDFRYTTKDLDYLNNATKTYTDPKTGKIVNEKIYCPTGNCLQVAWDAYDQRVGQRYPSTVFPSEAREKKILGIESLTGSGYEKLSSEQAKRYNNIPYMNPSKNDFTADSWDIHGIIKEKGGTNLFTDPKFEWKWDKMSPEQKKEIYKKIPIGSVIGMGGVKHDTTSAQGYNKKYGLATNRHSAIVVGYDDDGTPIMYDEGKYTRIDQPYFGSDNELGKITNISYAKEFAGKTKDYLIKNKLYDTRPQPLSVDISGLKGIVDMKETLPFVETFKSEKTRLMNDLDITNAQYDRYAKLLTAIATNETRGGSNWEHNLQSSLGTTKGSTQGLTQLNIDNILNDPKLRDIASRYGIKKESDLYDPRKSAIASMIYAKSLDGIAKKNYEAGKKPSERVITYNNRGKALNSNGFFVEETGKYVPIMKYNSTATNVLKLATGISTNSRRDIKDIQADLDKVAKGRYTVVADGNFVKVKKKTFGNSQDLTDDDKFIYAWQSPNSLKSGDAQGNNAYLKKAKEYLGLIK